MNAFVSTRGQAPTVSAYEAIINGIAPDGGLYVPTAFDKIDIEKLLPLSERELFASVLYSFLGCFDYGELLDIVKNGYSGKFETDECAPLVKLSDRYVLELFHGPTCAFKDVALCLLPHFIMRAALKLGITDEIRILTATSGDTGKAALAGFSGVPGTSIIVFYPDGGVSEIQKLQMVTQEGGNVRVFGVKGNFDDAQTGVKRIFADEELKKQLSDAGVRLSSANSINLGRLAPQICYYFKAYCELVRNGAVSIGDEVDFCVPTGNFGNILAGLYAKQMGLPVSRLVCASNENKVLFDFFETGVYNRKREFHLTASPSMDILVSSNFERCVYLMTGSDAPRTRGLLASLSGSGHYEVDAGTLNNMRSVFASGWANDKETFSEIKRVWEEEHYLIDTHTAVASCVASRFISPKPMITLATASPYKFAPSVLKALGDESGDDPLARLSRLTGTAVPGPLNGLKGKEIMHNRVIAKEHMRDVIM